MELAKERSETKKPNKSFEEFNEMLQKGMDNVKRLAERHYEFVHAVKDTTTELYESCKTFAAGVKSVSKKYDLKLSINNEGNDEEANPFFVLANNYFDVDSEMETPQGMLSAYDNEFPYLDLANNYFDINFEMDIMCAKCKILVRNMNHMERNLMTERNKEEQAVLLKGDSNKMTEIENPFLELAAHYFDSDEEKPDQSDEKIVLEQGKQLPVAQTNVISKTGNGNKTENPFLTVNCYSFDTESQECVEISEVEENVFNEIITNLTEHVLNNYFEDIKEEETIISINENFLETREVNQDEQSLEGDKNLLDEGLEVVTEKDTSTGSEKVINSSFKIDHSQQQICEANEKNKE